MAWLKKNWQVLLILALAVFLRLFWLHKVPSSLNWDEVAIGWNAKTIFHTRRGEFGNLLPLTFQSFGDFKAPFLIYATSPLVGIFGLKEIVVRLPSALAGIFTVIVVFFLAKKIGKGLKLKKKYLNLFAYFSLIFITFSPWHIFFTRIALESNVALAWITLGVWLFFEGLNKARFLPLSGLAFLLSVYTYHSPKIFLPFFLLSLAIVFFKDLMKNFYKHKRLYIVTVCALILLSIPIIKVNLSQAANRAKGTSIFFDQNDNPRLFSSELVKEAFHNFSAHLTPEFFIKGTHTNYRLGLKDNGIMTVTQWLCFILGIIMLIKTFKNKYSKALLLWFFLGLLPSAIGRDIMPNNLRSLNSLSAAMIISAYGLVTVLSKIKKRKFLIAFSILFISLFSLGTLKSLKEYFIDYPVYSAPDWQYGYKQAAQIAEEYEDRVDFIIFTTEYGQPHIFSYFFQNRKPVDVFWGAMIKYWFQPVNWESDKNNQNFLLIGSPDEIPINDPKVIKVINYPDNTPAFIIAKP